MAQSEKITSTQKMQQNMSQPFSEQFVGADSMRQNFQEATKQLSQLYKSSVKAVKISYHQGKEDAYTEILKYLLVFSKNHTLRFIPVSEFLSHLQSKYD